MAILLIYLLLNFVIKTNLNLKFGSSKLDTCQTRYRLKNLTDNKNFLELKRKFKL